MEQEVAERFERIEATLADAANLAAIGIKLSVANTEAIGRIEALAEKTEGKLNALITVVDNWIRDRKQ